MSTAQRSVCPAASRTLSVFVRAFLLSSAAQRSVIELLPARLPGPALAAKTVAALPVNVACGTVFQTPAARQARQARGRSRTRPCLPRGARCSHSIGATGPSCPRAQGAHRAGGGRDERPRAAHERCRPCRAAHKRRRPCHAARAPQAQGAAGRRGQGGGGKGGRRGRKRAGEGDEQARRPSGAPQRELGTVCSPRVALVRPGARQCLFCVVDALRRAGHAWQPAAPRPRPSLRSSNSRPRARRLPGPPRLRPAWQARAGRRRGCRARARPAVGAPPGRPQRRPGRRPAATRTGCPWNVRPLRWSL